MDTRTPEPVLPVGARPLPHAAVPEPAPFPPGAAKSRTRRFLFFLALFLVVTTLLSLSYNLWAAARRHEQLALATSRAIFQQAVLTRRWNSLHGGVYVPVTAHTQPNPYLEDPRRDIVTTDGLRLTKLNPAFMTRLISELMRQQEGTQLHMTSLKPLRPENAPDAWERAALESFDRGVPERAAVVGKGETAIFRYLAPLRTEASCLPCHARQGYRLGDIRGGIAVSIPYAPFRRSLLSSYRVMSGAHILFLAIGAGLIVVLGRRLLASIGELEESRLHIRTLEGLLPICAGCKKIRTAGADPRDPASWEAIENYVQDRTDATFTHGLCPECATKYFGDYARE